MVNYNSPIIQQMMQSGVQFNEQVAGPAPSIAPQQPLMTGYNQQPNMYYAPPQFNQQNMGYYQYQQPMYGPGYGPVPQFNQQNMGYGYNPNNMYYAQQNNAGYFQQQPQRNPWDLINPSMDYLEATGQVPVREFNAMNPPTPSGQKTNPFMNSGSYFGSYQQQVPHNYTIKAYNPTGLTAMYSSDMSARLAELEKKYQKINADSYYKRKVTGTGYGYNYYGGMNVSSDMNTVREYQRERAKIEEEAKQNVIDFNIRLSKLAHSYKGDIDVNNPEEFAKIEAIYRDRTVEMTQSDIAAYENMSNLCNLRDITQQRIAAINEADRKVSEAHHKIIPADADLDTFLEKAGLALWESSVEKMMKKGSTLSERMSYDRFMYETERQSLKYDIDRYNQGISTYDPRQAFYELGDIDIPEAGASMYDPAGPQGPKVPSAASIDLTTGQLVTKSFDQWKAELEEYRKDPNYCAAEKEYERQREAFARSVENSGILSEFGR